MTWLEVIRKYMKLLELEERMVVDRNDWRRRIHVLDSSKNFYVFFHIANPKLLGLRLVGLVYNLKVMITIFIGLFQRDPFQENKLELDFSNKFADELASNKAS